MCIFCIAITLNYCKTNITKQIWNNTKKKNGLILERDRKNTLTSHTFSRKNTHSLYYYWAGISQWHCVNARNHTLPNDSLQDFSFSYNTAPVFIELKLLLPTLKSLSVFSLSLPIIFFMLSVLPFISLFSFSVSFLLHQTEININPYKVLVLQYVGQYIKFNLKLNIVTLLLSMVLSVLSKK